ncbi:hypothetical protein [Pseudomonas cichorii]|uniref:Uncharacterized protein n=1 Tax=Pseudomonas cichorii TaxID=36746 RepID=A0A3M4WDY7_PSECI|nr:hypothetical protein [Pseudomonas cichorii]RMR62320.1 hypothetical protein ALP84_200032 [Pseudomonas cichorii]
MDSQPTSDSAESLWDYVQALNDEQKIIRSVSNSALLLPVETVLSLLKTSLREILNAARQYKPHLPVDKTVIKLLRAPDRIPTRGTFLRLFRDIPHQVIFRHLIDQQKDGYAWPVGDGWYTLFASPMFRHEVARDFWINFVQEAKTLNAVEMRSDKGLLNQLHAYANAPSADRFGCTAVRHLLVARLNEIDDENVARDDTIVRHAIVADRFAVLLRILAWLVADMVVDIWEMVEQDGMQDIVPFESLLPAYDPVTGQWSNPTTRALEQLAKRAGWKHKQRAITFLGNLWDKHDSREKEPGSRTKTLRHWEQRKKGRPKFETLRSLAHAVTVEQALLAEVSAEGRDYDTWMQAVILRIGETLSETLHMLTTLGIEESSIRGVMDAYRGEYRFARAALGKPMSSV